MDRDIQDRVNKAIQAGANPQEAMRRGSLLQQQRQSQSSISSGDFRSSNLLKNDGIVGNVVNALARPFVNTGRTVLGSAFEVGRAAMGAAGNQDAYATQNGQAKIQNPFLSQQQLDRPQDVLGQQVKDSAAIASYGIPVGGTTKLAGQSLKFGAFGGGALAGGLQSLGDENASVDSVVKGALTGGVVGKGLEIAGKAGGALGKGGNKLEEAAKDWRTPDIKLKASLKTPRRQREVREVLKRYNLYGTPEVVSAKLEPTVKAISKKIEPILKKTAREVPLPEIEAIYLKKIVPEIKQGRFTLEEAQQGLRDYIQNVSKVDPQALTNTPGIFSLKSNVNSGLDAVYEKIKRGTPLAPTEKTLKAIRDTFDEIVGSTSTKVKKLTLDQSALYDAVRPIDAQTRTVPTVRVLGNTVPKSIANPLKDKVAAAVQNTGKLAGGKLWPGIKMPSSVRQALPRLSVVLQGIEKGQPQGQVTPQAASTGTTMKTKTNPNQITPEVVAAAYFVLPRAKADIIKQIYDIQSKAGGAGKKLTEKQAAFESASSGAEYALQLLDSGQVSTGLGQGLLGNIGEKIGTNSPTQQDYRSTIAQVRTIMRNALLGANMSPRELESLSPFIPEFNDAPNIAKQKLMTFIRESRRLSGQNVANEQFISQTPQPFQ